MGRGLTIGLAVMPGRPGIGGGRLIQTQGPFFTRRKPLMGAVVLVMAAGLVLGANAATVIHVTF